ncbi:MAG: signal peptidase II [Anaerolineales bacterium]
MNAPQSAMQPRRSLPDSIGRFIKNYWSDYMLLLVVAAIIVTTDQLAKMWVRTNIPLGGYWLPAPLAWLMPYARLYRLDNSGAAFGIFQNGNLVFTTLAILVIAAILYYFPRVARKDWWLRLALLLQFSGAIGNLTDRLQFGHVTDFISVGNFAIFNISDACISVGVVVLVLGVWITEMADKRRSAAQASAAPAPDKNEDQGG